MPEPGPEWAHQVLQRRGVLLLPGPGTPAVEVLCADVSGASLLLLPLAGPRPTLPVPRCRVQFVDASGVFQLNGTLAGEATVRMNNMNQPALRFEAEPASATLSNRRSSYRVGVTLKGELALFEPDELGSPSPGAGAEPRDRPSGGQERLAALAHRIRSRKRACIVQDLSLGGARVVLPAPAPRAGQTALLDIALARRDVLRNVSGTVLRAGSGGGPRGFDAHARLRFDPLPGQAEARLARLINEVQLKTLRHGVRDRR